MIDPLRVLFVCVENSCRSQLAEGFALSLDEPGLVAHSAGSRPSGEIHPRVVALMAEKGIDLSGHSSKGLDDLPPDVVWDYVVTMGCDDACPHVPARHRLEWDLEDPKDLDEEGFRRIAAEIERRVRALVTAGRGGPAGAG